MSDAGGLIEAGGLAKPSGDESVHRVVRSRYRGRDYFLRRVLLVADMLGLWLAVGVAMAISGERSATFADSLWILPTLPAWAFLFRTYGLYRHPIRRFEPTYLDDVSALFHALVIGTLGLWLFYKVMPPPQLNLEEVVIFGMLALPLIATLRAAARVVNLRIQGPERVFVVAPLEDVKVLGRKLHNHPEYEMELVGAVTGEGASEELDLPLSASLEDIERLLASHRIDHLVVELDSRYMAQGKVVELMRACHREGVRFGAFPKEKQLLLPGVEINHVEGMGFLSYHPPVLSRTSAAMKRGMDVAVSALLLALFALPMALIAAAIKLDSKGTVLYKQVRVGKHGERFLLFKFRTMVPDADRMDAELMARSVDPDWLVIDDDPRVTRVGRFLRHRQPRRAAAAVERAEGGDEPGGAAAAERAGRRGSARLGAPPARPRPGGDRLLAGARPQRHPLPGDGRDRLRLRGELVDPAGPEAAGPDHPGGAATPRGELSSARKPGREPIAPFPGTGLEERLPSARMSGDFAEVYDEQVWNVYGFFAYRVSCRSDAEDLTQHTFERALRAWSRFDPQRAPVGVWLLAIARNLLVDHYRAGASSRHRSVDEVDEENLGSEEAEPDLGIDPELAAALALLSPRDREIIALRFGADLTGPEIAELTGLSLANVQQILSRSLRRLRTALDATTSTEEVNRSRASAE